ncbi:MAG TPA: type IV pilin N-terminal domain-containing protein, partial [Thermoplasmata archaeon]|nr:type IV pilin N-terminal domain-containing protein [Thermoplasmata archaeon]
MEVVISPQIKFKKKWLDNKGVSEIIGTILMLAITVVLFSSIMVFVTNMPSPVARPTVDFLSDLTVSTDSSVPSSLTLSHNGGEPLNDYDTTILLVIDGSPKTISLTGHFSDGKWSIGRSWTFTGFNAYPLFGSNTTLEAMIIDTNSNSQIWDSKIRSGAGNNAPVILQRWTDSDNSTLTADPIIEGDSSFWLYARVTDLDSDLQSVTVDASSIPGGVSSKTSDSLTGGVWGFKFTTPITQASLFDGKPLFIIAKDTANHWANTTFILTVSASERGPTGLQGPKGDPGTGTP